LQEFLDRSNSEKAKHFLKEAVAGVLKKKALLFE
jgi:hypothetical protein